MKTKKGAKKAVKYVRELSIVVIGIAITLTGNEWISNRNEKKVMQSNLKAVKFELEENLKTIDEVGAFYGKTTEFAQYLLSDKPENLSQDSLNQYRYIIGRTYTITFKTSAFEMLKMSGTIRLIKDNDFLKSILDTYTQMEDSKQANNLYMNRKDDEMYKFSLDNNSVNIHNITALENRRLFYFFALDNGIEKSFWECSQQIKRTLALF